MVTLRIARTFVESNHKLRVAKVALQGTATNPKLRVSKVAARGTVPLVIPPVPDQWAEAYAPLTIAVSAGSLPSSTTYTWRQVSGPTVSLVDNGTNAQIVTPSAMLGTTVVLGCTPQVGAQVGDEVTATVNVYPHLFWTAVGGVWTPVSRKATA